MTEQRPSDLPKYFNLIAGMVENDAAPKQEILEAFQMMNVAIELFEAENERLRAALDRDVQEAYDTGYANGHGYNQAKQLK